MSCFVVICSGSCSVSTWLFGSMVSFISSLTIYMYNNNKIVSWKQIELSKKEHNILTWRCPLVEHEETLEALILLPCSLGSSSWFLWIDGTASTFKAVLGINGVPGIDINLFSKSSALKCSEHSREFAVGDHRFVRTKLAHSRLRFFSDVVFGEFMKSDVLRGIRDIRTPASNTSVWHILFWNAT